MSNPTSPPLPKLPSSLNHKTPSHPIPPMVAPHTIPTMMVALTITISVVAEEGAATTIMVTVDAMEVDTVETTAGMDRSSKISPWQALTPPGMVHSALAGQSARSPRPAGSMYRSYTQAHYATCPPLQSNIQQPSIQQPSLQSTTTHQQYPTTQFDASPHALFSGLAQPQFQSTWAHLYDPNQLAQSLPTMTFQQPSGDWYIDTGVSSHMTSNSGFADSEIDA